MDNPCISCSLSQNEKASCCGCPSRLEWERKKGTDIKKDLIDRQAAIDVVGKWFDFIGLNGDICLDGLMSLPSEPAYTDEEIQKMQDIEQAQIEKAFELGKLEGLEEKDK